MKKCSFALSKNNKLSLHSKDLHVIYTYLSICCYHRSVFYYCYKNKCYFFILWIYLQSHKQHFLSFSLVSSWIFYKYYIFFGKRLRWTLNNKFHSKYFVSANTQMCAYTPDFECCCCYWWHLRTPKLLYIFYMRSK